MHHFGFLKHILPRSPDLLTPSQKEKKVTCCLFHWMNGFLTHPDQKTAAQSAGCWLFDKQWIMILFVWKGSPLAAFRAAVVCCVHKTPPTQAQPNQYTSHPKDPSEPDKQFGIPRDLLPSYIPTITTRQDCRGTSTSWKYCDFPLHLWLQ